MALLQEWQKIAYNEQADRAKLQKFWQDYFLVEKGIYEKLLDHPDEEVSGTVKELADKCHSGMTFSHRKENTNYT